MDDKKTGRAETLRIVLEKAGSYRSLHADGVMVTPNANNDLVLSVYSERLRFPSEIEMVKDENDEIVENVIGDTRGLFREISASIYIDLDKVEELISELERARDFLHLKPEEQEEETHEKSND